MKKYERDMERYTQNDNERNTQNDNEINTQNDNEINTQNDSERTQTKIVKCQFDWLILRIYVRNSQTVASVITPDTF